MISPTKEETICSRSDFVSATDSTFPSDLTDIDFSTDTSSPSTAV
ncbi:MAG: hypothetical protein CM15mV25_1010 [uncultured marine virus]|nr:MAG: hypothetical protein CM15mV25_1010 [uncultured marine virus]